MMESVGEQSVPQGPVAHRRLMAWMKQGARSAFLMAPDWTGLRTTPGFVAALVIAGYVFNVLAARLYIVGDATFYWPALASGWLPTVVGAWTCWWLVPEARATQGAPSRPADAMSLYTLLMAQALVLGVILAAVLVPVVRFGTSPDAYPRWIQWSMWLAPAAWIGCAQLGLVWRSGSRRALLRALGGLAMVAAFVLAGWANPLRYWYPVKAPLAAEGGTRLVFTQELMELQPQLLATRLAGLKPQRPGVVDLYAITFAPYASQDVFMRESALVAGVMAQRFDAAGRTIQLVNNNATAGTLPWATPLNLKRTIDRIAQQMDRDEDVLFIHLTSHGGADGQLAADFPPMDVESVTPRELERWLDGAGIRYRVISVSACYSGGWIEPLAGDGTLVMTAADADHTSYGCGSRSPLTFFGKAMYDEELRRTWSFERAHAAARRSIERREREAGKSDGYSNPQIRVGAGIRKRLALLEARLGASRAK
jgi:hypothetical protein